MINRLTISNLKGLTRSVELEDINIVHGPNSSGKSALLDGLKLALLGYHPRLGNKPNLTWQLASPGVSMMTVATNGASVTWKQKPNGSVTVEGLPENPVPAVLLDLQEWLALSGPARIQYVLEHSGTQLSSAVEEVDKALQLCPKIDPQALKLDRTDTAKFLRQLGVFAKGLKKVTQAELDVVQGAINQALLEERTIPENPERELRGITKEIQELEQKANQVIGQRKTLNERLVILTQKIARATAALEKKNGQFDLEKEQKALDGITKVVEGLEGKSKDLIAKIDNSILRVRVSELVWSSAQTRLNEVQKSGNCPTCGAVFSEAALQALEAEAKLKSEVLEADRETLTGHQNELEMVSDDLTEARSTVQTLAGAIRTYTEGVVNRKSAQDALKALQEDHAQTQKTLEATPEPAPLPVELTDKRDLLSVKSKEYSAWKGTERQRAEAVELKTVKHEANEQAKALVSAIKAAEEGIMDQVVGGLIERSNLLIQPVLGQSLGYTDGDFTLGNAHLSTVSGSEETVVFAGIQLALTHLLPERILVLDELHRLDAGRFESLLVAIEHLIQKKVIRQFIGVVPGGKPESSMEFNAIEMKGTM